MKEPLHLLAADKGRANKKKRPPGRNTFFARGFPPNGLPKCGSVAQEVNDPLYGPSLT